MPEPQTSSRTYAFADFILNPQAGTLTHRGYKVRLQDQPLRLLALLAVRAGEVVTREEIQAHLWPENTYVEFDKSLRVAVSKVREALRDNAERPNFIETVPRRGYRFVAPVTVKDGEPSASAIAAQPETPETATSQATNLHRSDVQARRHSSAGWLAFPRWLLIGIPVALLLIVPLTYVLRHNQQSKQAQPVSAHPLVRRSVAVLGLRNLGGDPKDRWLSTAFAEMLSAELSASENLRVIPGEEVAHAGLAEALPETPSHETLTRYAHQLGADMIVYGAFAVTPPPHPDKTGEPLRLDLRLENFSSDAPSLVLIKTGNSSNLFDLVTATGSDLRQRLGVEAPTSEAASAVRKALPTDPTAAQYYAEGLNRLHLFDALGARDLLQKAAKIEPGHAGTHLAMSDAWNALGYDKEALAEAQLAAKLAEGLPRQQLLTIQGKLALRSRDGSRATEIFRTLFTFYPDNVDYGLGLATAQELADNTKGALATLQSLHWKGIADVDQARIDLMRSRVNQELGNFREELESAEHADQIGQSLGLNLMRASALQQKASALERTSRNTESLAASAQAADFFAADGDKRGEAIAMLMRGDVQYDTGKLGDAHSTFESALQIFEALGNKRSTGVTLERLGNVFYEQGALPESRKYYERTLAIYRDLHLDGLVCSAVGNIANVQDAEGDIAGSIKSNEEGLALFQKTGDERGEAVTLSNMGNTEMERGGLKAAQDHYKHSEEINRKTGYVRGLAFALIGQGDVLIAQNDLSGGMKLYREATKLVEGSDEPEVLTNLHNSLGYADLLQGQTQAAIDELNHALDLALKRGDHSGASFTLSLLARGQVARNNTSDATASVARALSEAKLQFSPSYSLIALIALARVEIAKGDVANARRDLLAAVSGAQRYGYSPLALEARILLARNSVTPRDRRQQLNALSQEAAAHGWQQLAAEARKASMR
jgi:DNA-binding winged helix-turn-helix (wHTH) protein/tetratricopeptide (TPR) repeat protein